MKIHETWCHFKQYFGYLEIHSRWCANSIHNVIHRAPICELQKSLRSIALFILWLQCNENKELNFTLNRIVLITYSITDTIKVKLMVLTPSHQSLIQKNAYPNKYLRSARVDWRQMTTTKHNIVKYLKTTSKWTARLNGPYWKIAFVVTLTANKHVRCQTNVRRSTNKSSPIVGSRQLSKYQSNTCQVRRCDDNYRIESAMGVITPHMFAIYRSNILVCYI